MRGPPPASAATGTTERILTLFRCPAPVCHSSLHFMQFAVFSLSFKIKTAALLWCGTSSQFQPSLDLTETCNTWEIHTERPSACCEMFWRSSFFACVLTFKGFPLSAAKENECVTYIEICIMLYSTGTGGHVLNGVRSVRHCQHSELPRCVQIRGRRKYFPFTRVLHYNEALLLSSLVITHYEIITLMWLVRKRRWLWSSLFLRELW